MNLQFSPFLPIGILAVLPLIGVGLMLGGLWRRRALWLWRGTGLCVFALALANPLLDFEQRNPIKDVAALLIDRSGSQSLAERPAQIDAASAQLRAKLGSFADLELREIDYGGEADDNGTQLFYALREGLKDVSPERLAGVIMLTDGQVHDIPKDAAAAGLNAPLQVLLTGHAQERDRRIESVELPKFGIVGKEVVLKLRVLDTFSGGDPGRLNVLHDGQALREFSIPVGQVIEIPVKLDHAGPNVVEVQLAPVSGELTEINNRLVVSIEGVRDRVRVLLVSGAPNPGERTWRNVLKSDPNVDLVHYTILRFPSRIDDTPVNELSLISFPMEQLFSQDLEKFDLVIFDRYANQAPLPEYYFDNIANYVRRGGALLVSVGPDYAESDGLGRTGLSAVLPAEPTGQVLVSPFVAAVAPKGEAHPVMRDLAGPDVHAPNWAPFYRQIEAQAPRGDVLMSGSQNAPLLVLSHEDKGRVALLLTDQLWLWARGLGGGGPHVELLRRVSHWLLKEPALEEEALRASVSGTMLNIERQSLKDSAEPVNVRLPNGETLALALSKAEPGLWRGQLGVKNPGLYEVRQGELRAFASFGLAQTREFAEVMSVGAKLRPLAEATGGSVRRLSEKAGGVVSLPNIIRMRAGGSYAGSDYIGLKRNELSTLTGLSSAPLALGFPGLALLGGMLLALWLLEAFPRLFRFKSRSPDR